MGPGSAGGEPQAHGREEEDGEQGDSRAAGPQRVGVRRKAIIKAEGGGGLGRSRIGMVRGSRMSMRMKITAGCSEMGCRSWKCWEAALLPRTTCFKNKRTSQKNLVL